MGKDEEVEEEDGGGGGEGGWSSVQTFTCFFRGLENVVHL